MVQWRNSFYVTEAKIDPAFPWTLTARLSASPYVQNVLQQYTDILAIMLLCVLLALFSAHLVSRRLVKPLSQLAGVTTNLPEKMLEQKPISWVESQITEIALLIRNFRTMALSLQERFGEIYQMNATLEQKVQERTRALQESNKALREQQQMTEQIAKSTLAILYIYDLIEQRNVYSNYEVEKILGYSTSEIRAMGNTLFARLIHTDDLPQVIANQKRLLTLRDDEFVETEYRMQAKSGEYRWLLSRDRIFERTPTGQPKLSLGVATDITPLKESQIALHQQTERQQLLMAIAQRIRQTLNLDLILQTTVTEVQKLLHTDRVIVFRFNPDGGGVVMVEAVQSPWKTILGSEVYASFLGNSIQCFQHGQAKAVENVSTTNLPEGCLEILTQFQVKAYLLVSILQGTHLWGLLIAQQCSDFRQWQPDELDLLQQLATQVAIAIQQAELFQQVQNLNSGLEKQIQDRTAQLEQALEYGALLKRITDQVRDSLDEEQILQKVIRELATVVKADCCDTAIYNAERTTSTIKYEYSQSGSVYRNETLMLATTPDPHLYTQLFEGQYVHFCRIGKGFARPEYVYNTVLACPIADDQEILGDMWIFREDSEPFSELEIHLVQQVATQCAITLRQSRLYQTAQAQVQELERLNHLKDDFLSTVSHELRSPMSNIKMATQMLEINLNRLGILQDENSTIPRYFKILQEEGQREISLINDLLDLARVDAGTEPLNFMPINLQFYIPHVAETFTERFRQQEQQFTIQIPDDLPPLHTDLPYLERVLTELLHNASKYTPPGGTVAVSAEATPTKLEIRIGNSGVEIPAEECDRIFDKFYRIPNNDPWKHGGTGLGLALVKKLVERCGGTIHAESSNGSTSFILRFDCK
jgi:PAS domain S-box-containing protein